MNIAISSYVNVRELDSFFPSELQSAIRNLPEMPGCTSVTTMAKEFLRQRHHLLVFTALPIYISGYWHYVGNNIEVFIVGRTPHTRYIPLAWQIAYKLKKLIRLREEQFDIIHANWTYEFTSAAIKGTTSKPVVCTVRDWCPYIIKILFKEKRWRSIISWIWKYLYFLQTMRSKKVNFIANSSYTAGRIRSYKKISDVPIIPNPIEHRFICPMGDNVEASEPIFLTIAQSMNDLRKNIPTLLKSFSVLSKEFPNAQLWMIGAYSPDGIAQQTLSSLELGNKARFLGSKSHDEVISIIDQCTCLIHPSLEETFGNILIEAMARRKPVIGGKNSGAVPEVLDNGKAGCLCDVECVESMANSMRKIITDDAYRETIANAGHKRVSEIYSDRVVILKHVEHYKEVIKSKMPTSL